MLLHFGHLWQVSFVIVFDFGLKSCNEYVCFMGDARKSVSYIKNEFLFSILCAICFLSLTFDRKLFHSPSAVMEANSPSKVRSRADKDR